MYKSKLQELCHRKSCKLPEYSVFKQGQDHDPRFEAIVTVNDKEFRSQTPCKSSKQAQNEAAKLAFDFFSLPSSPSCPQPQPQPQPQLQPQPPLQPKQHRPQPLFPMSSPPPEQLHCISQFPQPSLSISSFPQPSLPSHLGTFDARTKLDDKLSSPWRPEAKLEVANETSEIEESTKDSSVMNYNTDIKCTTEESVQPNVQDTNQSPVDDDIDKGFTKLTGMQHLHKNQLQNFAQKRNLTLPIYTCERDGPPHASRFRCKVEIGGRTYESSELFATLKDAENAVAKVALLSCQDGAQENPGLYKNFLQEMAQKRGLGLPAYSTLQSGEVHAPIFVSIVKVGEETFEGQQSRTKKQAEMSAAKVAYISLKEGGQASQVEVVSSSSQSNVSTNMELVRSSPSIEKQPNDGGPCSISTRKRAPSCDLGSEVQNVAQHDVPSESNNYVLNLISKLEAGKSSSSKRIFVCPREPNMKFPQDSTILSMSDDKWVAFSLSNEASQ
ncbi:double-stranded RNA-binding protein 1-like isoform X2 [Momordica charantia]|uniref:Double-stranded RNA-binding protein 1-like isoform X2 n=1 Tax=Momordica charantia TaxID=3673 RepID=A0A6J1D5K6_MOMCH|nr:double-stranded RNA-binding protein 1-like isoform X2 [Momordica charantia]